MFLINVMDDFISINLSFSDFFYCSEVINIYKLPSKLAMNIHEYFTNMRTGEIRLGYLLGDALSSTRKQHDKYIILSCHNGIYRVFYPKNDFLN